MLDAEVTSIHRMTSRVKQFQLRRTDGGTFEYEPGQHTHLHFEDAGEYTDDGEAEEVVRPYTPTSLPGTSRLTLAIKRYDDGTASRYMHDREPGDVITIEEPDGNLYLRDLDEDVVLLASGTGLTPDVAMLRHHLREGSGDTHLVFGEKTQADLMYRETLDGLEAEHDGLSVTYVLSDEEWAGRTGHAQEHVDDVVADLASAHVYVCGVPGMVVETKERLDELGVPDGQVFSEGWEEDEVSVEA